MQIHILINSSANRQKVVSLLNVVKCKDVAVPSCLLGLAFFNASLLVI